MSRSSRDREGVLKAVWKEVDASMRHATRALGGLRGELAAARQLPDFLPEEPLWRLVWLRGRLPGGH